MSELALGWVLCLGLALALGWVLCLGLALLLRLGPASRLHWVSALVLHPHHPEMGLEFQP